MNANTTAILQCVGDRTVRYRPPAAWGFLRPLKTVRVVTDFNALLSDLSGRFSVADLREAGVVQVDPDGQSHWSPLFTRTGTVLLVLHESRHVLDFIGVRGALLSRDPPAFTAAEDPLTRRLAGQRKHILVAFDDFDLGLLSLLDFPVTSGAGLSAATGDELRRFLGPATAADYTSQPADDAPPIRQEYTLVCVNWNVHELSLKEPAGVREAVLHLAPAAAALRPCGQLLVKSWQPSVQELSLVQTTVRLRDRQAIRHWLGRSMLDSARWICASPNTPTAPPRPGYAAAHRALADVMQRSGGADPAHVGAAVQAVHGEFNREVVGEMVAEAMRAEDPVTRMALLAAAELAQEWHRSSDLVIGADAPAAGSGYAADPSDDFAQQRRLRLVDGILRIHRELRPKPTEG